MIKATLESTSRLATKNPTVQQQKRNAQAVQFTDNREQAMQLRKLQRMADASPKNQQLAQLQNIVPTKPVLENLPIQKKENNTGLPNNLKAGVENLSGFAMDDVKVHYNSNKPAQLNAHAYAQGSDIHIAAGQEKHLPHEAWHVVQQKQGRVKPTMQMKGNININDDTGLEKEADVMGAKALQMKTKKNIHSEGIQNKSSMNQTSQLKTITHGKECGCSSCNPQLVQRQITNKNSNIKQLTCDLGHPHHPKGPCRVKDLAAFDAKRDSQSHPQHGGDAKGREKMYEKRKK